MVNIPLFFLLIKRDVLISICSQVEICLSEVLRSDIFIGIVGGRYGWIPSNVDFGRIPGCERLHGHCEGRSITELEMNLFALTRAKDVVGRAFFYFRDQNFMKYELNNLLRHYSFIELDVMNSIL